jgi:AmmeMemoRadiSam system protein A
MGFRGSEKSSVNDPTIDERDRRRLLDVARRALEARVRREQAPAVDSSGTFALRRGAFVSIHCRGDLRGCLGRLTLEEPLGQTILHLAGIVADSDPRFDPVLAGELAELEIEISVLTLEREVTAIDEIEIGRHGVIVEDGCRRGLLLPQVASEHGWDRATFLNHACLKAGLPPDAWLNGARILVFEAQVFCEDQSGATTDI